MSIFSVTDHQCQKGSKRNRKGGKKLVKVNRSLKVREPRKEMEMRKNGGKSQKENKEVKETGYGNSKR